MESTSRGAKASFDLRRYRAPYICPSHASGGVNLKQIRVRWGDLGSPLEAGTYRCGPHMVEVTPGDIKLAEGNPDAVFTAIHPDFYTDETPYLLTGVELPGQVIGA
jgi:hypothetical protein